MPLVPGLSPSIRQPGPPEKLYDQGGLDIKIEDADEDGGDKEQRGPGGELLRVEHDDGSITVSLDGVLEPAVDPNAAPPGWFDNLAEKLTEQELSTIADDLLRGIEDDLESRKEWLEDYATGLKLLGLRVELPSMGGASEGAPVEGMSRVRHPLLQEAVLRFQANARAELLPVDGPVKVRDDSNGDQPQDDALANALEKDLNHYLTVTATEYYPDTDRMLLLLGFSGSSFKKVYQCPLRNRPVSESVNASDLIVNNSATDLANAKRVTHRSFMRPSTVKRLQILGVYRDVALSQADAPKLDPVLEEKNRQQGISQSSSKPDDNDREIYECYCELDIKGFEHKHKGKVSGLEIPYRVTIDVSSKEVLSIVRNFDEDTKALPEARVTFVPYTFVPGFGFYGIGLLHILGNTTNALTAAWRELLDAGMFSNFPGFLLADTGARQNTSIFRIPPGGGQVVKTGGVPIKDAIMALPYKEPSTALMQLTENMAQTGMRVGGTSEAQVGEGRADAPVGTTLAMIDQATKVLNSVHKRLHAAQAEEFRLLVKCFRENPESFWERNKSPARPWDEDTFLNAINSFELTPQADPNTASHGQRVMKIMALKQLQGANPSMYDPIAVDTAALQAIGWSNPQQFLLPPDKQGAPPPEMIKMQVEAKAKDTQAQATMITAQSKAAETQAKIQSGAFAPEAAKPGEDPSIKQAELRVKQQDNEVKMHEIQARMQEAHLDIQKHAADNLSNERVSQLDALKDAHSDEMDIKKENVAGEWDIKREEAKPKPKGPGLAGGKK